MSDVLVYDTTQEQIKPWISVIVCVCFYFTLCSALAYFFCMLMAFSPIIRVSSNPSTFLYFAHQIKFQLRLFCRLCLDVEVKASKALCLLKKEILSNYCQHRGIIVDFNTKNIYISLI